MPFSNSCMMPFLDQLHLAKCFRMSYKGLKLTVCYPAYTVLQGSVVGCGRHVGALVVVPTDVIGFTVPCLPLGTDFIFNFKLIDLLTLKRLILVFSSLFTSCKRNYDCFYILILHLLFQTFRITLKSSYSG